MFILHTLVCTVDFVVMPGTAATAFDRTGKLTTRRFRVERF